MYYREHVCQYCGGPRGVHETTQERFEEERGKKPTRIGEFFEHTEEEARVGSNIVEGVILYYETCFLCRSYEY